MAFAIIQAGGKQYRVEEGVILELEKIDAEQGEKIEFPLVVLYSEDGENAEIGTPFLEGKVIEGEVVEQFKGEKIRVVKKQAKKRMEKVQGHRQYGTRVKITKV